MLSESSFWLGDDTLIPRTVTCTPLDFVCCCMVSLKVRKWNNKNICSVKFPGPLLLVS